MAPKFQKEEKTFTNSIGMKFTLILAGEFDMGSPPDEVGRSDNEGPDHHVKISKPFYFGIYPVTQKEWTAVMKKNPSNFKGHDLPVENVSWDDVQEYGPITTWLSPGAMVNLQLLTKRITVRPSFGLPSFNPSLFILARASLMRDEIIDRLISVERLKSNANTLGVA